MAASGARVLRINLNGGDEHDWPTTAPGSTITSLCYRGRAANWPSYVDHFMRVHGITDLVLFGDCRPMHLAAHRLARLAGIRVHVFEEGYIRPNWLTLERDGVNGHSSLPRSRAAIMAAARGLPMPPDLPPIGADLGRRVADTWAYFRHMVLASPRYPFHRSHRPGSIIAEGAGWIWHQLNQRRTARRTQTALDRIAGRRYFLFPLQLSSDYQIRVHSPFSSMAQAAEYVLESFAAHAPADACLVIKEHPLDFGFFNWESFVAHAERRYGLHGRLFHLAGGDMRALGAGALGMVVVNSTSATFALADGVPVMALSTAVYAIGGLVHAGTLGTFWTDPTPPDPRVWDAFSRVLHARCLVRGGLGSEASIAILVDNALARLLDPKV